MLSALLTFMLLGGNMDTGLIADIHQAQDRIKDVLPRGTQRDQALEVMDTIQRRTQTRRDERKRAAKDLRGQIVDETLSAPELERLFLQFDGASVRYHEELIGLRAQLKEHITREQWQQIFSGR